MDSSGGASRGRLLPAKHVTFGDVTIVRVPTARAPRPADFVREFDSPGRRSGHEDIIGGNEESAASAAVAVEGDVCVFCREGDGEMESHCGMKMHLACALWCPEVFYDIKSRALANVEAALERCCQIKCAECRRTGAAIGCVEESCQRSYHLHCAVAAGAALNEATFELCCLKHRLDHKDA